jgi:hypothetical protein
MDGKERSVRKVGVCVKEEGLGWVMGTTHR